MNGKAFLALLARDAHVARRNLFLCSSRHFSSPCCLFLFSGG